MAAASMAERGPLLDWHPRSLQSRQLLAASIGLVAFLALAGFALGASFENSVVFDETRLLNTEGLRYADECARHKVLDVIGDLALSGLPLLGAYRSVRGGHKLNHAVLCALMADQSAWRMVEAPAPPRGAQRERRPAQDEHEHGRHDEERKVWDGTRRKQAGAEMEEMKAEKLHA